MSKTAKSELKMQKERRVAHCQKSMLELAELEVKHAKAHAQMLRQAIQAIKAESWGFLNSHGMWFNSLMKIAAFTDDLCIRNYLIIIDNRKKKHKWL